MADKASEKLSDLNLSNISGISKMSKYADVICPHFKNGGKCIHCIKDWKEEQKKKKNNL